jgi:membrane protease YdiL (CAAX protease family)
MSSMMAAGLSLGSAGMSVRIVLGVVGFILLQPLLNWAFGLGSFQGLQSDIAGIHLSGGFYLIGLVVYFLILVIGGPLSSLIFTFGEEYGWRGFLQDQLQPLGRIPSAIGIGLIWWAWHTPIILSGVHTYPPTVLGFALALIFFVLWGIVQSYVVLKTGSVWTAAFVHGLVNGLYAFSLSYLVRSDNSVLSFGLGVYGLVLLLAVVLWLLRDSVWRARPVSQDLISET